MNKKLLCPTIALIISFSGFSYADYIMKFSNSQSKGMIPEPTSSIAFSSCKEILENGESAGDGIYTINVNNKEFDVYCDMTSSGGGWTMVVAQFEQDPVANWNEGIQADYDPSLASKKGFALNSQEIPNHTQTGFGRNLNATYQDFSNYVYTTGNLSEEVIYGYRKRIDYHIYRNDQYYYSNHDVDGSKMYNNSDWNDSLAIDEVGPSSFDWGFSPKAGGVNNVNSQYTGYAMGRVKRLFTFEDYAWTVWVR